MHVYRPLPPGTPRVLRQLATFVVSSFWHGIHPGYYLCFAGMFVMVNVEALVRATLRPLLPSYATTPGRAPARLLALACHLWTMSCFCFTGVAFNMLRWRETLSAWASLDYYGVWLAAAPAAIGMLAWATVALGFIAPPAVPLSSETCTEARGGGEAARQPTAPQTSAVTMAMEGTADEAAADGDTWHRGLANDEARSPGASPAARRRRAGSPGGRGGSGGGRGGGRGGSSKLRTSESPRRLEISHVYLDQEARPATSPAVRRRR